MNVFERSGNLVEMSAVSDLVNGWPGGIIQATRHGVFLTPIYLVNQLYSDHLGDVRLAMSVDGSSLDAIASRGAYRIYIKAVNTNLTSSLTTTVVLQGFVPAGQVVLQTVSGKPVSVEKTSIPASPRFVVTLPKQSVSVITIEGSVL
jgi:alpha-L-arabinofuranosidase